MSLAEILGKVDDPEERQALGSRLLHEIARRRRAAASAGPRIVRTEKRCPGCGATKLVAEFGRNAARPDGLQSLCRGCR
ncbi:hypothetical protein JNUCC0626_18090 [Lentzea sp. JNUCC 0626]|uniref:hypothetical protein n=1 Tax=Lentzea sp. JNUCC 0626 TaxID=3367513 RepID=UPI003747865C